jgi:FKBP-type peptidyl-prolyl cis-trans isomerase FkpA
MNKLILSTVASALILSSCKNDGNSAYEGYTRAENGLHYKFFKHDEKAPTAKLGDGIYFSYVIKTQDKDSLIVDSKQQSQDGSGYTRFMLQKSSFKGSLEDGMMLMAKGDSASFIVPADSFFTKTYGLKELPPGIKAGMFLKATLVMKDILSPKQVEEIQAKQKAEYEAKSQAAQAAEKGMMDKYLADNKITTKPTESGLIFIETKKGNGTHPKMTDEVTVHYTGTLLNGEKFDSSIDRGEPATFALTQVIRGWTEGIQLMTKGSKCKLVIPSSIGYGPQGNGPKIPPFSALAFDVELLDFKPAPAPSAQQMQSPNQ